ncbi:MAG TPA: tryptophan synthase subunit alpha [Acidiferrobacteraceae bacterium]|nr:tryptophan synthase subunit alpha [Acidiferrobacteraceae bacterium]
MSRLGACFAAAARHNRRLLIPFLMAGDPRPSWTPGLLDAVVEAGADIIEIGIPFSDPMADGPAIQQAHERALRAGLDLRQVLALIAGFRATHERTPVVLMGYLNPIESMGYAVFADAAAASGVDGLIVVDMPLEESAPLDTELRRVGIDLVLLVAPTTGAARLQRISRAARGFLYYVSLRGVTGASHLNLTEAAAAVKQIQAVSELPVALGFGIDGPDSARAAAQFAEGVVVGSALVRRVAACADNQERACTEARLFLGQLRAALDDTGPGT